MAQADEIKALLAELKQLREENAKLRAENAELKARQERTEAMLLEAQRAPKRQAAPFRREEPKPEKKPPGRPKGHQAAWRPQPEQVDETVVVDPPQGCEHCGGALIDLRTQEQFVDELPVMTVHRRRFVTTSGFCPCCKCRTHRRHPDQISVATGAAGTSIGPNAAAFAVRLRVQLGAPLEKIAAVLQDQFGLRVSAGGLFGIFSNTAQCLDATYQAIAAAIRSGKVAHVDETGWWVRSLTNWAWVFANDQFTLFVITNSRSHKVALRVLGPNFGGCLVSDCLAVYNVLPYELKSKCLAHFLRTLKDIERLQTRGAVNFPRRAIALLKEAITLAAERATLDADEFSRRRANIGHRIGELLAGKITDSKNLKIANRLRKHQANLLTFLYQEGVDATNNLAERQLRPLVLSRKISAGNKTERGAKVTETLTSVFATCRQQGVDFTAVVLEALKSWGSLSTLVRWPRDG